MRLAKEKLDLLKRCFTEEAMSPGQAAKKTGVTYATANRYYEKWSSEIRQSLERQLVPRMQESIRQAERKTSSRKSRRTR
jgi:hypothetical protein